VVRVSGHQISCCPSEYDLEIIREVILVAEEQARREYARGSGGRDLTLLKLLRAYEQVRVGVEVWVVGTHLPTLDHPLGPRPPSHY
jgi:hypothetical protein